VINPHASGAVSLSRLFAATVVSNEIQVEAYAFPGENSKK
jgi:hypothetical protein